MRRKKKETRDELGRYSSTSSSVVRRIFELLLAKDFLFSPTSSSAAASSPFCLRFLSIRYHYRSYWHCLIVEIYQTIRTRTLALSISPLRSQSAGLAENLLVSILLLIGQLCHLCLPTFIDIKSHICFFFDILRFRNLFSLSLSHVPRFVRWSFRLLSSTMKSCISFVILIALIDAAPPPASQFEGRAVGAMPCYLGCCKLIDPIRFTFEQFFCEHRCGTSSHYSRFYWL